MDTKVDRYGFIRKAAQESESLENRRRRARKENERTEKWRAMMASSPNIYRIIRSREFSRRVIKGIPEPLRGYVWTHMLVMISDEEREWAQSTMKATPVKLQETESGREALEAIEKDLNRTYPLHVQFQSESGQALLRSVLSGYASFDTEVGYCQGMSFVAATFLMYLPDDEALCLLKWVMNNPQWSMRDMYKPDMAAVGMRFYQYETILGRAARPVARHFKELHFEPSMYSTHWFATVFTYNFPFFLVLRIWDIFLLKGWPIVIGAAVAFWRMHMKQICRIPTMEGLFDELKRILANFSISAADDFVKDACYIASKYSTKEKLKVLELEYFAKRGASTTSPHRRNA